MAPHTVYTIAAWRRQEVYHPNVPTSRHECMISTLSILGITLHWHLMSDCGMAANRVGTPVPVDQVRLTTSLKTVWSEERKRINVLAFLIYAPRSTKSSTIG